MKQLKIMAILLLLSAVSFAQATACEDNLLDIGLNKLRNPTNALFVFAVGALIILMDNKADRGLGPMAVLGIVLAALGFKYLIGI